MNTISRYMVINSFIHRLDSRLKLALNITIIVLVFVSNYFITTALLLVPLMIAYVITTKSWLGLLKLWKMPLFIGVILYFVNLYTMKISNNGVLLDLYAKNTGYVWYIIDKKGTYAFSYPQLIRTLALVVRIYTMILTTSIFVISTKPILLTKAIEDLLWPLKLLFINTHILATIISIALRFIPTLLEEAQRIMKTQASRGIDFKNGKINEKAKSFTTLVIPLFVTSFNKAEDLANAMETRGYDPYAKRTRYRKLIWHLPDYIILLGMIGLTVYIALSQNMDFLPEWYTITYSNF
ncbi:Energy-coupling factor transporter transmembrane protein EcfT [Mycoplasmopsis columbinasalis]|uniref:Energy-coupling factor transporter transmembrane protein EcfT n=2 Tax=Mycoplasmopsis columbinasalis TaxID=114880 RepID=A0A449B9Y4_9BACT|nr:energy-coupling factor transporter transmembrane component T [Mycoplasmopsis columbinasalis]VEU78009.1 Energy-coupling factor transporter transmembrane protein EcfT [Mycoplasmopsis columbinasalis]